MAETWKPVHGFEGLYEVSAQGHIRNAKNLKIIKPRKDTDGYLILGLARGAPLKRQDVKVHRVVAQAFLPNPENRPQVNHLNGVRDDPRAANLEWATVSENHLHAYRELGREPPAQRPVIGTKDGVELRFDSVSKAARAGFNRSSIQYCLRGEWKQHRGYEWRYGNV
jgi:hypothetical protein